MQRLRTAEDAGDYMAEDHIRSEIQEEGYDIGVRSDWHTPGCETEPTEYYVLLAGGGPACRIRGDLDRWNEPESARIEYQDWFTAWESIPLSSEDEEYVVAYAGCFWFGE